MGWRADFLQEKDEGGFSEHEGEKKRRGLSSYWRRIELRFLSNSEDRTNLKSAGSRRWILTTICWHFAFMRLDMDTAEFLIRSLFISFAWNFHREADIGFSRVQPFLIMQSSFSPDSFIGRRDFWNIKWNIQRESVIICAMTKISLTMFAV